VKNHLTSSASRIAIAYLIFVAKMHRSSSFR